MPECTVYIQMNLGIFLKVVYAADWAPRAPIYQRECQRAFLSDASMGVHIDGRFHRRTYRWASYVNKCMHKSGTFDLRPTSEMQPIPVKRLIYKNSKKKIKKENFYLNYLKKWPFHLNHGKISVGGLSSQDFQVWTPNFKLWNFQTESPSRMFIVSKNLFDDVRTNLGFVKILTSNFKIEFFVRKFKFRKAFQFFNFLPDLFDVIHRARFRRWWMTIVLFEQRLWHRFAARLHMAMPFLFAVTPAAVTHCHFSLLFLYAVILSTELIAVRLEKSLSRKASLGKPLTSIFIGCQRYPWIDSAIVNQRPLNGVSKLGATIWPA